MSDTTIINPRSIGIEGAILLGLGAPVGAGNLDAVTLADLKATLIDFGTRPEEASGIIGWLVDKSAGRPDVTSGPTRWRYRNRLRELAEARGQDPASPIILGYAGYVALGLADD